MVDTEDRSSQFVIEFNDRADGFHGFATGSAKPTGRWFTDDPLKAQGFASESDAKRFLDSHFHADFKQVAAVVIRGAV